MVDSVPEGEPLRIALSDLESTAKVLAKREGEVARLREARDEQLVRATSFGASNV